MYRIGKEEAQAAARVIESGSLFRVGSLRREVEQFETEWAARLGLRHSLLLTSGTGALAAALVAVGVGPGDEVIVPAYTFIATPVAVLMTGAIPVIAEIDETMTLDMADVARKCGPHTRAVIPVHIQGFPCDMGALQALQREKGFYIIEDAAQAAGGTYRGRPLGAVGDVGAYSFNQFKIITAGEGGAFVTDNDDFYRRAVLYHDCGAAYWSADTVEGTMPFAGTNLRASEITGAIMRVQLGRLDGILADLRRVKRELLARLSDIPALRPTPSHDAEGDCGTTLAFLLPSADAAAALAQKIGGGRPCETQRHVYVHWSPIMEKRGAGTVFQNPYLMPQNAGLNADYSPDMCPRTLDYLSRTVYLPLHCDWGEAEIDQKEKIIRMACEEAGL